MKVKSASQTAGHLGKDHAWVGHFKNHLNEGHNDGPKIRGRVYEDALPKRNLERAIVSGEMAPLTMDDSAESNLFKKDPSAEYRVGRAQGETKSFERLGKAFERRQRYSGSGDI